MILGVCHKNITLLQNKFNSKVHRLWLNDKTCFLNPTLNDFVEIAMQSRLIVFKMTAQITQIQQKRKKFKKKLNGPKLGGKSPKFSQN